MKELKNLIKKINELIEEDELLGKEKVFLDCSYFGYRIEMHKGYGTLDLSQRGTKKETLFFLLGMLKTLELLKKGEIKIKWMNMN